MTIEFDKLDELRAQMNREWLGSEAPPELRDIVGLIEYGMRMPQWRRRNIDRPEYAREEMFAVLLARWQVLGGLKYKPEVLSAGIRYCCDNIIIDSQCKRDIGNIMVDALFDAILDDKDSEVFWKTKEEVLKLASGK